MADLPDLYEKPTENDDRNKLERALAARLSSRATRQYVGRKENLKERVKGRRSGMAYLGAAGWYIPVPTVLGAWFGQWLDAHYPYKSVSWSLNLILLGLAVGMINMWSWLKREAIDEAQREQESRNRALEEIQRELKGGQSEEPDADAEMNDEAKDNDAVKDGGEAKDDGQ